MEHHKGAYSDSQTTPAGSFQYGGVIVLLQAPYQTTMFKEPISSAGTTLYQSPMAPPADGEST